MQSFSTLCNEENKFLKERMFQLTFFDGHKRFIAVRTINLSFILIGVAVNSPAVSQKQ